MAGGGGGIVAAGAGITARIPGLVSGNIGRTLSSAPRNAFAVWNRFAASF
jgi:hypothetical protein